MDWSTIPQLSAVGMLCLAVLVLARVIWWQMDKVMPRGKGKVDLPDAFAETLAEKIIEGLEKSELRVICADCPVQTDVKWVKGILSPRKLADRDVYDWKWSEEDRKILRDLRPVLDRLADSLPQLLEQLEKGRAIQEKTLVVLSELDTRLRSVELVG